MTLLVPSCNIHVQSVQHGLDFSTQNAFTYVDGHLLREKMGTLVATLCYSPRVVTQMMKDNICIRKKSYNVLGDTGLYIHSAAMGELVDIMATVFVVQFSYYVKEYNLLANLVSVVEEQCFIEAPVGQR